jgi:hypothetical protein
MNQFTERVVVHRWSKLLVDQMDELHLGRLPLIALKDGEPLRRVTRLVEGGEEHLAGLRRLLNTKELITAVQSRERVLRAIICGKKAYGRAWRRV